MSLVLIDRGSDLLIREATLWQRLRVHALADRLDYDLAAGVSPDTSVEHSLRAQYLSTPKQRTLTAQALWRSLNDAFDAVHVPLQRSARLSPLTRSAVRSNAGTLRQIAAKLDSPEPVASRGLATLRLLVTKGAGPLHYATSPQTLGNACARALRSLEAGIELEGPHRDR